MVLGRSNTSMTHQAFGEKQKGVIVAKIGVVLEVLMMVICLPPVTCSG